MRWTIARKLTTGLVIVSSIAVGALAIVYWGLATAGRSIRQLSEQHEPISRTTHEMEINLKGVGLAVFKYLDSADDRSRARVADDTEDFERFHARYLELSRTDAEKHLGATLGARFAEFRALAQALIAKKDEQEAAVALIGQNFERLDDIIDNRLQPDPATPGPLALALVDVEADVAELLAWLATYQRTHNPEHRALMQANEQELRRTLQHLRGLPPAPHQRELMRELLAIHERTMALAQEILATDDYLQQEASRFDALRETLDELLDEQAQPAAYEALYEPRRAADRATQWVVRALQVLLPILLLATVGVGLVLMRLITRPLGRLHAATVALRAGNLSHRVEGMSRDEFGDLAEAFNAMASRLEETTVSKGRLEASESQLRATVADLRSEIHERRRAEREQARLQESLRRSEKLSAMGSLVAGLAHEVRNPLFGISSTVDALEARLGPNHETRRHLTVLRAEVERLSQLARHLLDYGRPAKSRTVESITAAVDDAIRQCTAQAQGAGVTVERRLPGDDLRVVMDRSAMVQVFRNLLENAIQHSTAGGAVVVSIETVRGEDGPCLDCAVHDAGPGLPEESLERVFDPFFTRRPGGTGLGLSIVQRIVEQHGGQVHAANGPGRGAVLTVRLPLAEGDARTG